MEFIELMIKGRWQWKSNKHPFSTSEDAEWKYYPLDHNDLLEKSYYDQQEEVDLGDYIVSVKTMRQKRKGNSQFQRPIRRINWMQDIEEIDQSERHAEPELPKTINNIFGDLRDFTHFFSKRTPEIFEFGKYFDGIERSNDLKSLHTNILPKLVAGLKEELQTPILKELNESNSKSELQVNLLKKKEQLSEILISLFKKEFSCLKDFYKEILKAYTMNTSLYGNLNRYLRNENWSQIDDNLLPYAYCFCKAFFGFEFGTNLNPSLVAHPEDNSIFLYRGTAFTISDKSFYNPETRKNFSWNSATSASKNISVAKGFMEKVKNPETGKYPVLFIIEVPVKKDSVELDYLRWIDVQEFSFISKEEEVILPPGSTFELQEVEPEGEKTIIRIKLKNEIRSLAYGGLIMHGARYSEMMTEKEVKVMCLEGGELHEALKCLMGNKLIEEIEFCMCTFDDFSFEKVFTILPTIKKLKGLKFISCLYKDKREMSKTILDNLKISHISNLEISEVSDFYEGLWMSDEIFSYWNSLSCLTLNFGSLRKLTDEEVSKMSSKVLRGLINLTSLSLDFSGCSQITDEGIENLCSQGVQYLTRLLNFSLNLSSCLKLTDEVMTILCNKTLKNRKHLELLSLNFSACQAITDRGVVNLGLQALTGLIELKSLNLSFSECRHVTDKGMHILFSESLNSLVKLQSLSLDFNWQSNMLNKEISFICSQWLVHLNELNTLNLNFGKCLQISNEDISRLCLQGLSFMKQLVSLDISFYLCTQITDKGLANLFSQGLKHLTKLKWFKLSFGFCVAITDKGIDALCFKGLKNLKQLMSLDLDFSDCDKITEKGFSTLFSQGISYLSQLKILKINSKAYPIIHPNNQSQRLEQIVSARSMHKLVYKRTRNALQAKNSKINTFLDSVEICKRLFLRQSFLERRSRLLKEHQEERGWGLEDLQMLYNLSQLADLNFDFSWCEQTVEEANTQHFQGFKKYFAKLTSINLKFYLCGGITDQEVHNFCSFNVSLLTQLISLSLDFRDCCQITDESVKTLSNEGFKNFTQLTSLDLNFSKCEQITDQAINTLCYQGLNHLPHLTSFGLNCSDCETITDEAIMILYSQGFQQLHQVQSLNLDFSKCYRITFKGIKTLFSEKLQRLQSLTSFALKLQCMQMANHPEDKLSMEGLGFLKNLKSLNLDLEECMQITDEEVENLCSQGIRNLNQLKSLALNFSFCPQVTNEGVQILFSRGIKCLTQLISLNLRFKLCHQITDQGVQNLCSEGFSDLKKLESLNLDFSSCQLTDEGIGILCYQGLSRISQLTSLSLHLCHLTQLTNEGINIICTNGLSHLVQLTSLTLSFDWCEEITDEGLNNLCSQGLKHLPHLEFLDLDLSRCKQITPFTISNVDRVMRYFDFMTV